MLTIRFPEELIISMLTNGPLAVEDVRQALVGRGPIASITPTGPSAAGSGITAWLVEFRYYADCKEAIRVRFQASICLQRLLTPSIADARQFDLPRGSSTEDSAGAWLSDRSSANSAGHFVSE